MENGGVSSDDDPVAAGAVNNKSAMIMAAEQDQEEVTDREVGDNNNHEESRCNGGKEFGKGNNNNNDLPLAPTRLRRTYSCRDGCEFNTFSPRAFLYHRRDEHQATSQIFECPHCVYASNQINKRDRHVKLVHKNFLKSSGMFDSMELKGAPRSSPALQDDPISQCEEIHDSVEETGIKDRGLLLKKLFCCTQCSYASDSKKNYEKHLKSHEVPTFLCDKCEFNTSNKWHMSKHTQNHNGEGKLKCDICCFSSNSLQSLSWHKQSHHKKKKLNGTAKSDDTEMDVEEMEVNSSDAKSNDSFDIEAELKDLPGLLSLPNDKDQDDYLMINDLWYEKKQKCQKCSFKTVFSIELDRHECDVSSEEKKENVDDVKSSSCRLCNVSFNNQVDLSKHMNTMHKVAMKGKNLLNVLQKIQKPQETGSETNGDGNDFQASTDSISIKNDEEMKKYIGGTPKDPFCKVCGYKAKWISELEKHIRVHTQEKPFPCPYCKHSARWKGDLTRHIQKIHPSKIDEFYDTHVNKRKMRVPKPHPVQYSTDPSNNKMVFPGMEQPDESDASGDVSEKSEDEEDDLEEPAVELNKVEENIHEDLEVRKDMSPIPSDNSEKSISLSNISENFTSMNNNNPSGGSLTVLKKVKRYMYKCLSCDFVSRTASRFHVHIVQHLNKRPYMCSECGYRSNWEWDITKHIKMKTQKKENHTDAKVVLVDEAGRKNYEKYNKYRIEVEDEVTVDQLPSINGSSTIKSGEEVPKPEGSFVKSSNDISIRVTYKCKTCNFQDCSKRTVISHIISHLQKYIIPGCGISDSKIIKESNNVLDLFTTSLDDGQELYVCNICPYKSGKNGYIKMHVKQHHQRPGANYKCHFCPYWVNFRKTLLRHLKLHVVNPNIYLQEVENLLVIETPVNNDKLDFMTPKMNISKSVIQPKFMDSTVTPSPVKAEHGNGPLQSTPYLSISPVPSDAQKKFNSDKKKFFCEHCPYESDNRTQYLYHKQFHRPNRPAAHKCRFCSYSVSHLHLLRQHMKVHTISGNGIEASSDSDCSDWKSSTNEFLESIPNIEAKPVDSSNSTENKQNKQEEHPSGIATIPSVLMNRGNEMVKMFKCRFCPLVNRRRANVRVHEQMHMKGNQAKFVCPLCNYQCNNQGVLTAHIKIHQSTEVEAFTDQIKVSSPQTSSELSGSAPARKQPSNVPPHLLVSMPMPRVKYRAQNYRCGQCPGVFKTQSDLDNHMKFHGINLPFKCTVCDYAARCKPHLHNHLKVHSEEQQQKRHDLSAILNKSAELPVTSSSPSVTITAMPTKQSNGQNLGQNALLFEEANACIAQLNGNPGNISCSLCPARFKVTYLMQFHKALHGSGGHYKCSRCSYAVSSVKNMSHHSKLHSGTGNSSNVSLQPVKPYRCPKCPATFNKVARFHRHISLHGVKNRYRCDQCDYSVRYAANLIKHKQVHHQNVTPTHRFDENEQVTIRPVNKPTPEHPKQPLGLSQNNPPVKFIHSRIPHKNMLFHQQQQNKEWLQESVNHVIAEDIDPKTRIFRCDRCPYIHGRKDAVQNHLRRHVAYQGLRCPHCDYYTMHMCFVRDHMKLHFNSGSWMKQHNYSVFDGMEITATNVDTGEKNTIFRQVIENKRHKRFEPELVEEFDEIVEANTPVESIQIPLESAEFGDANSDMEFSIENYGLGLQRFNGLSMVPKATNFNENTPKEIPEDFDKDQKDWYGDDKPVCARDYVQAMESVENLEYVDVLQAIDKFIKDDFVPTKSKDASVQEAMDTS